MTTLSGCQSFIIFFEASMFVHFWCFYYVLMYLISFRYSCLMDTDIQKRLDEKRSCRKLKKDTMFSLLILVELLTIVFLTFLLHNFSIFYIYQTIKKCSVFLLFSPLNNYTSHNFMTNYNDRYRRWQGIRIDNGRS
jgi:hypothetical protein